MNLCSISFAQVFFFFFILQSCKVTGFHSILKWAAVQMRREPNPFFWTCLLANFLWHTFVLPSERTENSFPNALSWLLVTSWISHVPVCSVSYFVWIRSSSSLIMWQFSWAEKLVKGTGLRHRNWNWFSNIYCRAHGTTTCNFILISFSCLTVVIAIPHLKHLKL